MTAPPPPTPGPPWSSTQQVPRLSMPTGVVVGALAVLLIALGELDNLIGQVMTRSGLTYEPTALTRLSAGPSSVADGWRFLFGPHDGVAASHLDGWLTAYAFVDFAFMALYGTVGLLLLRRVEAGPWIKRSLLLGVGLDVIEGVLILLGAWGLVDTAGVLPWASGGKWFGILVALVGGMVAAAANRPAGASGLGTRLRRLRRGLYTHRYSVLVVLPLVALGLAKGPDLLEQLPDIQRRWIDDGVPGLLGQMAISGPVTGLIALTLFVLGRLRTDNTARRALVLPDGTPAVVPDARTRPVLWIWFVGPGVVLALAVVSALLGGPVDWVRVGIFCGIPLVIGGVSWALRRRHDTFLQQPGGPWQLNPIFAPPAAGQAKWLWRKPKGRREAADVRATALVGDALTVLMVVVPGLGLVRAMTGVVALNPSPAGTLALVLGVIIGILGWPAAAWVIGRINVRSAQPLPAGELTLRQRLLAVLQPGADPAVAPWLAPAILAGSVVAGLALAISPNAFSSRFGVIPSFLAGALVLATLVGGIVVLQQRGGSPEAFWLPILRTASTPVTTLLVLTAVLATTFGGSQPVHPLRTLPPAPDDQGLKAAERNDMAAEFKAWRTAGGCESPLPGTPFTARPVVLYAAEGGGIRAATWTALALDTIEAAARPGCAHALMSSGASGGAVGLTIADGAAAGQAAAEVQKVDGPDALAVATIGLTISDIAYAATGVPVLTHESDGSGLRWVDRAGHIERVWEQSLGSARQPFVRPKTPGASITGALVLNSTSATTLCRALVSQVRFDSPSSADCRVEGSVPGSIDLVALAEECGVRPARSTAALLASRFPYVTPSGTLCSEDREQQFVDGGYAENTGIGTVVDVSPRWMGLLRAANDQTLDAGSGTLLVPLLVYLDNGTGTDLAAPPSSRRLEILIPPVTGLAAKGALSETDAQLQRAAAAFATDQLWSWAPEPVAHAVSTWRPHAVHVVYQGTEPGVAAPLGWVLSASSRESLERAMQRQEDSGAAVPDTLCAKGYGTLRDLLSVVGTAPALSDIPPNRCARP